MCKRLLSLFLAFALVIGQAPTVFAVVEETEVVSEETVVPSETPTIDLQKLQKF